MRGLKVFVAPWSRVMVCKFMVTLSEMCLFVF